MGLQDHPIETIVNVKWGVAAVSIFLSFRATKPVGVGDWSGHLTMATSVSGLPQLSQTSFSVVADSFLEGEEEKVTGEWKNESDDVIIRAAARLTTIGAYEGGISYDLLNPGSVPNKVALALAVTLPPVMDRNFEPMFVPIDLITSGFHSLNDPPVIDSSTIVAPASAFTATLNIQIQPPTMTLTT